MSGEGQDKLISRLEAVITTSRMCNEVTVGEVISALELIKLDLYMELRQEMEK